MILMPYQAAFSGSLSRDLGPEARGLGSRAISRLCNLQPYRRIGFIHLQPDASYVVTSRTGTEHLSVGLSP